MGPTLPRVLAKLTHQMVQPMLLNEKQASGHNFGSNFELLKRMRKCYLLSRKGVREGQGKDMGEDGREGQGIKLVTDQVP